MDHNQAVELQLAVKYVLGELPTVQRDEFEDHYIDCPECAKDVYAAAAFSDTAREVFREEARTEAAPASERERGQSRWFAWFRPVVAVPAFAALLLVLGYQSFVAVPHWKNAAMQSAAPRVLPMFSLIGANTRGPGGLVFKVGQGEPFGLYVDVPVDSTNRTYLLRLEDPAGNSTILHSFKYEEAQKTQIVKVDPGNRPGAYQIVVLGMTNPNGDLRQASVLATMKFSVEFKQ